MYVERMHALTLRAGPDALQLIRERGLRAADVDIIPAASGGPKWLAIAGLDRFLFGRFLTGTRERPMHLIGSSIGSWRMACLAQREPLAALERAQHAYIHHQQYTAKPGTAEVTRVLLAVLRTLLGDTGVDEILTHPWARLHVITSQGRGLANTTSRTALGTALSLAAALNAVSRRTLALQFRRVIFSTPGDGSPLIALHDLPTTHVPLTRANLPLALQASGSIPMVIDGVRIASAPGGLHWDGGVTDYHLDLAFAPGTGLVLYPHFYPHVVPGWFDKSLPWRHAAAANFRRTLILAPSAAFVATLPGRRIPDRRDFQRMTEAGRIHAWEQVRSASTALGDELGDLLAGGRIAERIDGWG
ncbi:MAG: patatin-like phospholipase family protein [Gemmatimonadaceae bacterium]|nr:patatin-like phospholipase family protein [Gemmatimonadaceae bacterium]